MASSNETVHAMKQLVRNALNSVGYRIVRAQQPLERLIPEIDPFQRRAIETATKYSMTGPIRMWTLLRAIANVADRGIAGDIVECGVWKGGNLILAGLVRNHLSLRADIWGYDTFEGMSAPTVHDRKHKETKLAQEKFDKLQKDDHNEWCFAALDEVRENFAREVGPAQLRLIKGKVEETLRDPENLPAQISVLRLDTDWYESTKVELEVLFPRLVEGGVLIIDDYGEWAGAKQAVDEYFAGKKLWLHYVDPACRMFVKS